MYHGLLIEGDVTAASAALMLENSPWPGFIWTTSTFWMAFDRSSFVLSAADMKP